MGWDNEYQCYTNQDNPFGDSALTHTFVWTKKLAKEGVKTVSRDELDALNRQKQLENKIELEKVRLSTKIVDIFEKSITLFTKSLVSFIYKLLHRKSVSV